MPKRVSCGSPVIWRAMVSDDALKDAFENVLEWNLALLMTVWFLLQARLWRRLSRG